MEAPILFLIQKFSGRSRIDDLVNDIFVAIRDRFYIGEEVTYKTKALKKEARILSVSYTPKSPKKKNPTDYMNGDEHKENDGAKGDKKKK